MNTKRKNQRNIILLTIIALVALLLTPAWTIIAGDNHDYGQSGQWMPDLGLPLDGGWIMSSPTPTGSNVVCTFALTAQDEQGLGYTFFHDHAQCPPAFYGHFPKADYLSDAAGQLVKTGPNTFEYSGISYGLKKAEDPMSLQEILYIWVDWGTGQSIDRNTLAAEGTIDLFLPEQDADGDGFPDEGQEPYGSWPYVWSAKRVGLMLP